MRKVALVILDGLGLNPQSHGNAISRDTMPFLHTLIDQFGHAQLAASGTAVGLDEDQVGNSEIGHLTIGAGRVLGTALSRIRQGFEDGSWGAHPIWSKLRGAARVHVAGLLSDAGVHAHYSTVIQTALLAKQAGAHRVFLHLFLDGIDSPRGTAPQCLRAVRDACGEHPEIVLASVSGRRWACDRSGRQEVTQRGVDALTDKVSVPRFTDDVLLEHLTREGESMFPFHVNDKNGVIRPRDPVILTHHRADRTRQLASALSQVAEVYSVVELEGAVPTERVFFPVECVRDGLIETLAKNGVSMSRVAESCKFAHVTYFLNGMRQIDATAVEVPSIAEDRIAHQPEMSLPTLTQAVCALMGAPTERAIAVNIPNLDQVGHTGDLELTKQAARSVDLAVKTLYEHAATHGWRLVVTADHGNADQMLDHAGHALGSHSRHPVPLVIADPSRSAPRLSRNTGSIANVAATLLGLLGIRPPLGMAPALIDIS